MNLFKTSVYSSLAQATSVVVGLMSVKIVASKIGPEGVALQGQFLNSTAILSILASGATGAGVIKYLAEYSDNKELQLKIIKGAFTITLFCSLIIAIIPIIFSNWFSVNTLKDTQYNSVYLIYGIFLPLISFNSLFSYILNGLRKIPSLTFINIFTSLINIIFLILLSQHYAIYGVLVCASFVSAVIFTAHLFIFIKYKWFSIIELIPSWDKNIMVKLFKFSSMSLLAGFGMPFAQILIRNKIISKMDITQAGYWQMVTRISDFYLSFIVAVLSVYFLPKLSELKRTEDMKNEIYKTSKFIFPIIICIAFTIWLGRDLIIKYLLTYKFIAIRDLFHYQLIGDIFKVGGWMLSNILWAKAMTKKYLIIDGFSLLIYVVVSFICIEYFGLIGATIGFLITYLLYFLLMVVANKKYLFK